MDSPINLSLTVSRILMKEMCASLVISFTNIIAGRNEDAFPAGPL